jgi:hypothetical protein
VHLSVIFISSYKYIAFSVIIGPVMGFHLVHFVINHLYSTWSICTSLGSLSVCHLKRSFTLSLTVISDCNLSFHFFISYLVDDPVLYEALSSLQLHHFQAN